MKPNYNSKQKYQDSFWHGKGRFLSWGSSVASGYDLVLPPFFTEETRFHRSIKCFQNQASRATQFSAHLCKALARIFTLHNLIARHNCLHIDIFTWTKAIGNCTIACLPFSVNIYNKKGDQVQTLLSNTHCNSSVCDMNQSCSQFINFTPVFDNIQNWCIRLGLHLQDFCSESLPLLMPTTENYVSVPLGSWGGASATSGTLFCSTHTPYLNTNKAPCFTNMKDQIIFLTLEAAQRLICA